MPYPKRYYRHSRISEEKFCDLLTHFAADLSATDAARATGLTRKSVTTIFLKLRTRIAEHCKRNSVLPLDLDHIQAFSCSRCICGRCRQSFPRNVPLFTLITLTQRMFTTLVPDCRRPILRALIHGRIQPRNAPVDGWHGYHALIDSEYPVPWIVPGLGADDAAEIKRFWKFARRRLEKFNGVSRRTFYLHLKESEWRFNIANRDLFEELLSLITENPL